MDPYKYLNFTPNPDGSLTRPSTFPNCPPTGYPNNPTQSQSVASIDTPLNTTTNTWIRIFHPLNLPTNNTNLPIIIYFHGGGFVRHSAASVPFHESCFRLASELPAVILSVEYRLAPENRLPLAYEDAVDAMLWVKKQTLHSEHKFTEFVDFGKCYIMGASSGGNIAYHAGLRAVNLDLAPVKINGLILDQPFFGGVERTGSQLTDVNDNILQLPVGDSMWELALPIGADRNHEYCNPMVVGSSCAEIRMLPRCFVNGYGGDHLVDRQKEFVKMLEGNGVCVVSHFVDDGFHGVDLVQPEKAQALVANVRKFIYSSESDDAAKSTL